jgi:hypothetical protein
MGDIDSCITSNLFVSGNVQYASIYRWVNWSCITYHTSGASLSLPHRMLFSCGLLHHLNRILKIISNVLGEPFQPGIEVSNR